MSGKKTEELAKTAEFLRGWSKGKPIRHIEGSCTYTCGKWATKLSNVNEVEAKKTAQELIDAGYATGTATNFTMTKPATETPKKSNPKNTKGEGTMSAKKTTETKAPERTELLALAKEMNEVMGLDPKIGVKATATAQDLLNGINKYAPKLEADDFVKGKEGEPFFSPAAVKTFTDLGIMIPKKPEAIKKTETGKKVTETKKKTGNGLPKYTRANAFADALRTGEKDTTKLLTLADDLYAKHGGTSNVKEAKWYQSTILPGLVSLGFAEVKDGHIKLLRKVSDAPAA